MQNTPIPTTYSTVASTAATNTTPAADALFSTPNADANANAYASKVKRSIDTSWVMPLCLGLVQFLQLVAKEHKNG